MINLGNITLLDLCPDSIRDDPVVVAMCKALDPELRLLAAAVRKANIWANIDAQPEWVLDTMAHDMRLAELELWDDADIAGKRLVLKRVFDVRRRAGTPYAVKRILGLLQLDAQIVEWFEEGADPFTFRIIVDATAAGLTQRQITKMPGLIYRFAPVRALLSGTRVVVRSTGALRMHAASARGRIVRVGP